MSRYASDTDDGGLFDQDGGSQGNMGDRPNNCGGGRFNCGGGNVGNSFGQSNGNRPMIGFHSRNSGGGGEKSFWRHKLEQANETLTGLFDNDSDSKRLRELIGKDEPEKLGDVKKMLAHVLKHGSPMDQACAILASCVWAQARNEIEEGW